MARSSSPLTLAGSIMEGAVRGGASRQVAAAVAAALMKSGIVDGQTIEVAARLNAIEPVIKSNVAAASDGLCPPLSSMQRTARNVASHNFEVEFSTLAADKLKAVQRGRRGRRGHGRGNERYGSAETTAESDLGSAVGTDDANGSSDIDTHEPGKPTSEPDKVLIDEHGQCNGQEHEPVVPLCGQEASLEPPKTVEDFLWNIHSILAKARSPLHLDEIKDSYFHMFGHALKIERFLVVGDGGIANALRRIPHIVTLIQKDGLSYVKAAQPFATTKGQLHVIDQKYRRDLKKRNESAKRKATVTKS